TSQIYESDNNSQSSPTSSMASGHLTVSFTAKGSYEYVELYKNYSLSRQPSKYFVMSFRTNYPASVALFANTIDGEEPLYPIDPTAISILNHYSSVTMTSLAYQIDQIGPKLTGLKIAISDRLYPAFQGTLIAEFWQATFA